MSSGDLHGAIQDRWATNASLLALVPLDRSFVGNAPAVADESAEIKFPYVARYIQGEDKDVYTSDGPIRLASVVFNVYAVEHADGQRVRKAFQDDAIGGFENRDFLTPSLAILSVREDNWGEFQDDKGFWQFTMIVSFRYRAR